MKKQGILPLTFNNPDDYDLIGQEDKISVVALKDLSANKPVQVRVTNSEGVVTNIETNHSMSEDQIEWFRAGSALNLIRQKTNG